MSTKAHPDYGSAPAPNEWQLRLYVTDWTPRCVAAYRNLTRICHDHISDKCNIEVVDLLEKPELAREDQIVAVPTLIKKGPKPERVLVGDFSKTERVLRGLDIEAEPPQGAGYARMSWGGETQGGAPISGPHLIPLEPWGQNAQITRLTDADAGGKHPTAARVGGADGD